MSSPEISLAKPPDAVCIIRLSAIGDCCHTVPVVRSIQSAWPATKITWVIGQTEYQLMRGLDNVEFIVFDKRHPWRSIFDIRRRLRDRHYPVLLHMHASMRANLVAAGIRADIRLGFDRARARDYQWLFTNARVPPTLTQHVMDGLFEFIEVLGIETRELRWDIPVDDADLAFAEEIAVNSGPFCIISPCSSQRRRNYRNWRIENYVDLARWLVSRHAAKIAVTGGGTALEREYGEAIAAAAAGAVDLTGRTSLKQLLALIGRSDLLICPDSGPAHMATAVGTPVIGLYATSNRHRTGPYFSQSLVVDKYPDAVNREFGKPVSELRWGQRVRNPDAMDLIRLQDVTEMAEAVLSRNADISHGSPA